MLFFNTCKANVDADGDIPSRKRSDLIQRSPDLTQQQRLSEPKQSVRKRCNKQDIKSTKVKPRPKGIVKVHRSSSDDPVTFRTRKVCNKPGRPLTSFRQFLLGLPIMTERAAVHQDPDRTPEPSKPQAPAPIAATHPISRGVAGQVKSVRDFIARGGSNPTVLDRDSTSPALITVPESSLLAAVLTMRIRYEVGAAWKASIFDVEEAIVRRFSKPFGQRASLDFVTIDAAKDTAFVAKIRRKIQGHGVDTATNLLEVQLEMNMHDLLEQCDAAGYGKVRGDVQQ